VSAIKAMVVTRSKVRVMENPCQSLGFGFNRT